MKIKQALKKNYQKNKMIAEAQLKNTDELTREEAVALVKKKNKEELFTVIGNGLSMLALTYILQATHEYYQGQLEKQRKEFEEKEKAKDARIK